MEKLNFEQMEVISGGKNYADSIMCNGAVYLASAPWAIGFGMISMGAGFLVGGLFALGGAIICA